MKDAGAVGLGERLEEAHFALAEDEHAAVAQILIESGEGEAGFLRMRIRDATLDAAGAGEQFEIERARFHQVAQDGCDAHARRRSNHQSGSISPRLPSFRR